MALLTRTLLVTALLAGAAQAAGLRAGDPAPAFTVPDWSGRPASLAALRGRPVCIDFWATWCMTCRTALPAVDAIARRHPELTVLAVNIDRDRAAADRFLAERLPNPASTILHDPGGALLARFGAGGMPALYLIDAEGTVRLVESGYQPDRLSAIEQAVTDLLTPKPPR